VTVEPQFAWVVPVCAGCDWRGAPCRTDREIAGEPTHCPRCGAGVGAELRKGTWRAFTRARVAALRERRETDGPL
jgi:hypothetical protein